MWRRRLIFWILLGLTIAVGTLPEVFLNPLLEVLIVNEEPVVSDAIVVLLGSKKDDRIRKAGELFRAHYARTIVFGSGFFESSLPFSRSSRGVHFTPAGDRYRAYLEDNDFTHEDFDVLNLEYIVDTLSELEALRDHARKSGWKSIILVTSPTHSRRVQTIWRRIAPDIQSRTLSSDVPEMRQWWECTSCSTQILYEYGAWIKEFSRQLLSIEI